MVPARSNGAHLRIEAIDPLIRIHVQFGDKAASDKTHSYFCHDALLRKRILLPAVWRVHLEKTKE
jgi:hypothetical protein